MDPFSSSLAQQREAEANGLPEAHGPPKFHGRRGHCTPPALSPLGGPELIQQLRPANLLKGNR